MDEDYLQSTQKIVDEGLSSLFLPFKQKFQNLKTLISDHT